MIVIQPNLITQDQKMGLQFGETPVVTKRLRKLERLPEGMGGLPGLSRGGWEEWSVGVLE